MRAPLAARVLAALCVLGCLSSLAVLAYTSFTFAADRGAARGTAASGFVFVALVALSLACGALFALLAARLLSGRCAAAERLAWALVAVTVLQIVAVLMLYGLTVRHIGYLVQFAAAVAAASYLEPALAAERACTGTGRGSEERPEAAGGAEGARERRGLVKLDFFNLFWVFVVCSVLGLLIETLYHVIVVDPGHYQDRAGLLFGPFSPIYGFGAVLMTVALNRFHDKNVVLIFLVSALLGGAFEYAVSWIMQFSFGLVAWNYAGSFLSIDGRTDGLFMAMWGLLGVAWIKLLLPGVLKLVHLIPWRWRYGVTAVCAALMLVDGVMTVQSIDCWYGREAGRPVDTRVERFYAAHFDDAYMEDRFQSMSMDVHAAARVDR